MQGVVGSWGWCCWCGGSGNFWGPAWQLASPAATNIKIENFVIFLFGKPAQHSHNSSWLWVLVLVLASPYHRRSPLPLLPRAYICVRFLAITCMSVQFLQLPRPSSVPIAPAPSCGKLSTGKNGGLAQNSDSPQSHKPQATELTGQRALLHGSCNTGAFVSSRYIFD